MDLNLDGISRIAASDVYLSHDALSNYVVHVHKLYKSVDNVGSQHNALF